MEVRFEEIPVDLVDAALGRFKAEIEKAIGVSGNETTYDIIRAQLLLGSSKLYYALVSEASNGKESVGGFIITELNYGATGTWVGVPWGYGYPKYFREVDLFAEAMEKLKETCRVMGFKGIRMLSTRRGMARRMKGLGFKPRFVEYVLEVNREGEKNA